MKNLNTRGNFTIKVTRGRAMTINKYRFPKYLMTVCPDAKRARLQAPIVDKESGETVGRAHIIQINPVCWYWFYETYVGDTDYSSGDAYSIDQAKKDLRERANRLPWNYNKRDK